MMEILIQIRVDMSFTKLKNDHILDLINYCP